MEIIKYYIVLLLVTLLGASGAFYFKKTVNSVKNIFDIVKTPYLYLGVILYFFSAVFNVIVLRYLPYTIVLPFTSVTYIWTLLLSNIFYGETIRKQKIIGIFMIIIGAFLIGIS